MSRSGPGSTPGTSADPPESTGLRRPTRRVSYRLPAWALIFPVIALLCTIPLATAGGVSWIVFGIPFLVLVSVLMTRTTADARALTATGLWRRRSIPWAELDRLEFTGTRWAVAVTGDGRRVRLPMVRPRDLPAITAVAGGELLLDEGEEPEDAGDSTDPLDEDGDGDRASLVDGTANDGTANDGRATGSSAIDSTPDEGTPVDGTGRTERP